MNANTYILDRFEGNWVILLKWDNNELLVVTKAELNSMNPSEGDLFNLEDGILKPIPKSERKKEELISLFNSLKKD